MRPARRSSPVRPASFVTSVGVRSTASAYSPSPETSSRAAGSSTTNRRYASAPASSPPPTVESRSTRLKPRSIDRCRLRASSTRPRKIRARSVQRARRPATEGCASSSMRRRLQRIGNGRMADAHQAGNSDLGGQRVWLVCRCELVPNAKVEVDVRGRERDERHRDARRRAPRSRSRARTARS